MKRAVALAGTAAVLAHGAVSAFHGWAHAQLGVELTPFQLLFVALVISLAPVAAAVMLWTPRFAAGAWLLALSMLGSLAFGYYHHYVAHSPDHVDMLPPGEAQELFRWTASLLITTEAVGAAVGAWGIAAAWAAWRAGKDA